jgi:hypothetical protein
MSSAAAAVKAGKASYEFWQDLKEKLFWIIGGSIIFFLSYILYNNMNKPVAGTLVFLGGFMALYYYYIKYFVVLKNVSDWPPYQSTCPDFLTLVPPPPGYRGDRTDFVCMDFVGVSINGGIKKADPTKIEAQVNDPNFTFVIDMRRYGGDNGVKLLKEDLSNRGLSWEAMLKGSSISLPKSRSADDGTYDA